jgi:hypothetical protein
MYREHGENFVPKYLALLEAGGPDSPEALLAQTLTTRTFGKGFQETGGLITSFEGLIPKMADWDISRSNAVSSAQATLTGARANAMDQTPQSKVPVAVPLRRTPHILSYQ